MADGLNRVILLGNLGQEPDLKVLQSGTAVLKLSLGCNESYLDRNNVRQEKCEWVRVTIFGKRAEGLAKILNKGDRVCVEGSLHTSSYDKEGQKHYSTEVNARGVYLCGSGKRGSSDSAQDPGPPDEARAPRGASTGGGDDFGDIPF